MFVKSAKELTKVKTITIIAILISMSVVCDLLKINIYITQELKISLSFLFLSVIGYLFGPVVAAISGASMDILGYLVNPTGAFMIGFTISKVLEGFVYGIFLYEKETPLRTFTARLCVNLLINCLINTLWLYIMYGNLENLKFFIRLGKNIMLLPFEVLAMHFIIKIINKYQLNKIKK